VNKSTSAQKIVGTPSDQTLVAELDSALNDFADIVPEHCMSRHCLFPIFLTLSFVFILRSEMGSCKH
jgi:hypothetical protein